MKITYSRGLVSYFVNVAPHGLFAKSEERKNWDEDQKLREFDKLWNGGFAQAVEEGKAITAEAAQNQLGLGEGDRRGPYFKDHAQHRVTRYRGKWSFIVQLNEVSLDELQVDQIWFVKSRDFDPLTICVTFPSPEVKGRFMSLADSSDKYGTKLLEKLVRDFMAEHGLNWQ